MFQPGDKATIRTQRNDDPLEGREVELLVAEELGEHSDENTLWRIKLPDGQEAMAYGYELVPSTRQDEETLVDAINPPTVFLSGPITNSAEWENYFNDAAARLREEGFRVLNPADWERHNIPREEAMQIALGKVLEADIVYLLPGWENSQGALVEFQVAQQAGKEIHYLDGAFRGEPVELTASKLVRNGQREQDYGHPLEDMDRFTLMITALLSDIIIPGHRVPPQRGALIMEALKMSRLVNNPAHLDSRVDLIGWPIVYDRVMQRLGNGPS